MRLFGFMFVTVVCFLFLIKIQKFLWVEIMKKPKKTNGIILDTHLAASWQSRAATLKPDLMS